MIKYSYKFNHSALTNQQINVLYQTIRKNIINTTHANQHQDIWIFIIKINIYSHNTQIQILYYRMNP